MLSPDQTQQQQFLNCRALAGLLLTSGLSSSTCRVPTWPSSSGSTGWEITAGGKGSVHIVGLWKVVVSL